MMASKSYIRSQKERSPKQNGKIYQDALPDEIALRDEILELKRQILILKKTNEQNLVKFRKHEDESKRKDKQIEQLMDPTKNSDIRKILSTKGAAILMNLKDQNNSLIQIILDKDLQIKRLLGELKTSKLYASSRKTEPYRAEIARLRNLLIKSQELLKEATDIPQKRSICIGGTPVLEINSSSDQSSPRELEELRFTIQSLETHMKYSNKLLAKKNQEIMILTDQLNAARNAYQCKTCNKNMTIKPSHEFDLDPKKYEWFEAEKIVDQAESLENVIVNENKPPEENLNTAGEYSTLSLQTKKKNSSSADLLELFEKTIMVSEEKKLKTPKIPKSAPVGAVRTESRDSASRRSSMPLLTEKSNGSCDADISNEQTTHEPISTEETSDTGRMSLTMSNGTSDDIEKSIKKLLLGREKRRGNSLLHDLAKGSLEQNHEEVKSLGEVSLAKEKWKSAIKKLKKFQRRKRSDANRFAEKSHKPMGKNTYRRKSKSDKEKPVKESDASGNDTDVEALETYEFEMMEKKIESDQIEIERLIKPNEQILERTSTASPKSPGNLKLIRQSNVIYSEETEELDPQPEDKKETFTKSKKVVISREPSSLFQKLNFKSETPKKSKIAVVSSRKSSTSSVSKSSLSNKSESSSKKSSKDSSKSLKKLSRNKNVEEPPVPMRRTKVSKAKSIQETSRSPVSTRTLSSPNLDLQISHDKSEETRNSKEMPNEIITYEISQAKTDTQQIKEEISNISSRFSPEIQKELRSLYENITSFEELEKKKGKSLREVYKQSVDSSFDSESSFTTRQEAKVVEVEVEINQISLQSSKSIESQQTMSMSQEALDGNSTKKKEGGENFFDDDDDDVVFG